MRSIDTALKALEKRAQKNKIIAPGKYCREHLPPPFHEFEDGTVINAVTQRPAEETDRTFCPICQKPYPPDAPRVTILFEDTRAPEQKPEQKPE
jgi:hypothetical protein